MKKLVIRDRDGQVINIGPWEYGLRAVERFDEGGVVIENVVTNPLPEGATSAEEEVVETADGGLAAAGDHVSLRRVEYPPLADQLDALWKGGADADAMRARILDIKLRHPKVA
jgi:hypothetical protein